MSAFIRAESTTIVTVGGRSRLVAPSEVPLFRCIEADPNWPERGGGKIKRGADRHYHVADPWEIIETIIRSPLWRPDRKAGCHLWLWVTNNALAKGQGHLVAQALGFRVLTLRTWRKDRISLGQYLRGETEHCLLCTCGPTHKPVPAPDPPTTFIEAPRREHSRKPAELHVPCMERVSAAPRAELYARAPREGWYSWGNDTALLDAVTAARREVST